MILTKEEQHKRMLETPMPRLVLSLAIPTTCIQLISTIYNTADTYFVSQIDTSATAAVGVVFSLMSLIQAVGMGCGMGAGSLISRCLGAKKDKDACRYASSAVAAALAFGVLLMILGTIFLQPLMKLLGSTDTMLPYSCSYGQYILAAAPIMCASFVLNNILRSEGEAVLAMVGLCSGGILNMILDPIFIFSLDMGISGAALATCISQLISFLILIFVFVQNKSIVQLGIRHVSRSPQDYHLIFRTGLPTICRQGLASLASALMNIQAAAFGDAAVAAITISNKIYLLVRNIILGIGQGFQPVAGYNYGAKNNLRVRQAFLFATRLGTVICTTAAVLLALHASVVIAWFRHDDAEVIRIGTQALYFVCMVMPFMAYSTYVNQIYQCLGFSKPATFLACCRQGVCFLPLVFLLPVTLGLVGVEMVQPGSDLLTFFIALPFQIHFFRHQLPVASSTADNLQS